jgi:hypothetical protein
MLIAILEVGSSRFVDRCREYLRNSRSLEAKAARSSCSGCRVSRGEWVVLVRSLIFDSIFESRLHIVTLVCLGRWPWVVGSRDCIA